MGLRVKETLMWYQEGNSDKEYNVYMEKEPSGCLNVFARYGRRGNTPTTVMKCSGEPSLSKATAVFNDLVASKTKKGYKVSSAQSFPNNEPAPPKPAAKKGGKPALPTEAIGWLSENSGELVI